MLRTKTYNIYIYIINAYPIYYIYFNFENKHNFNIKLIEL